MCVFRVEFARDAFQVRFGTLVKNIVGTDLGGVVTAAPGEGLAHVSSGEVIEVEVPIRMRLVPGTYFANVGVVGTVDGGEVFLHPQSPMRSLFGCSRSGRWLRQVVSTSPPIPLPASNARVLPSTCSRA